MAYKVQTIMMGSSVGLGLIMVQSIMMGSSVGLGLIMVQTTAKHMHNAMQLTWTDLKVGSMGHYNMGRR